nr:MAG TPA_asm: hypothetical protein [Caudoviricetes sp.]
MASPRSGGAFFVAKKRNQHVKIRKIQSTKNILSDLRKTGRAVGWTIHNQCCCCAMRTMLETNCLFC